MTRRILAYLLFAGGLLSVTFFRAYHGNLLPYVWLYWLIGAAMFVAGWALLRYTPTIQQAHAEDLRKKRMADLREHGEKIRVVFSSCTIKSNDFTQEQELFSDDTSDVPVNTEAWDEPLSTKVVEVHESVVVFKHKFRGKEETYLSEIIMKDPATLMFRLDEKKETYLYVDPADRSNYYFDLEFLREDNQTS